MSLKKHLTENVLFGSVGNILIKVFSAVGYALLLAKISIHDYGVFTLLVSFVGPAAAIAFFSFDRIFVSQFSKARGDKNTSQMKGLFSEYYRLGLVLMVFMIAGAYGASLFFSSLFDIYVLQFFWPTALFITCQLCLNMVSVFLESNEKFKKISLMEVLESLSRSLLVVAAFFLIPFSVTSVLLIYSLAKIIAVFVGIPNFLALRKTLFIDSSVLPERRVLWRIFTSFGKWEIASNIFEKMLQPVKLLLLQFFVGIESVAVYDFAGNVYAFMYSLFPVKKIIFPIISRFKRDRAKIALIISKAKKYALFMYVFLYIGVLIFTPFVLKFAFPQYAGYSLIIYLFALHFMVDVYKLGQNALLYAFERQKFMFVVLPLFILLQLISDIFFIQLFGIVGSVLSWHFYSFCSGLIVNWHFSRKVGLKQTGIGEFFIFDEYDKVVLSGIISRVRSYLPKF